MQIRDFKDKKILILGFGMEGIDSFKFLRKIFPDKKIGIADRLEISNLKSQISNLVKKDKRVKLHFGEDYLKAIKDYDVVVKSPGIPIHSIEVKNAFSEKKITSQTEIFFENCPGIIVGVTGTKGKSTTTALIYSILKEAGYRAHLVGNIGKPVLSLLLKSREDNIFVYELSCHQLYNLKKSPQVAVFLNLYPEHLDYYKNFKEYSSAKANIALHQGKKDFLVFNSRDDVVKNFAQKSKAQKIEIKKRIAKKNITKKENPLKGEFNLQNIAAAIEVGKLFKIPNNKIKKAIKDFKPLPHRLEFVGSFKGIDFYNDALSTIPETAIGAIEAFEGRVETIILGGFDRNIDFKKLARNILKNKIKAVILFPTTGKKIWSDIQKEAGRKILPKHFFIDNMKDAIELCYKNTNKGKVCLLSCASTSFNLFRDYKEKGNQFKKWIKIFSKKKSF